jgi:endonuclease YncB( thermonuclease family)
MGSRLGVALVLVALAAWVLWSEQQTGRLLELEPATIEAEATAVLETLDGVVSHVHDGDTVTLRLESGDVKVRLGQIDAPELYQPWGSQAMHALESAAEGRQARVEVLDVDRYDRRVARLFVDGEHLNETLVREGHAWAYRRWVRDPEILEAEATAQREGRGLWSLPEDEREPPWNWRRDHPRR